MRNTMRYSILAVALAAAAPLPAQTASAAATQPTPVEQAISTLRANGMPATFDDLRQPRLADDQNGVVDLLAATKLISPENCSPRSSGLEYSEQLPYPPAWHELASRSVRANAELLALARKAREKGGIAWGDAPKAPFSEWMQSSNLLPGFSELREIANLLGDAALYAHFQGDDAEAIARVQDLHYLGEAVGRRPFLVAKLVSIGILAVETNVLQTLATDLRAKPADRAVVEQMIRSLLDDEPAKDLYRRAFREERTILVEEVRGGTYALVPQAHMELPNAIGVYDDMIAAMDKPAWETVKVADGLLTQILAPSIDRVRGTVWKLILSRRIAAVSLAAALYRNDSGSYPASLNDLIPKYLPAIPADPYARDDGSLIYRLAEDGRRPLVGSVGSDGQEEADAPLPQQPQYNWPYVKPGEPDDIWLDLSPWNPGAGQ